MSVKCKDCGFLAIRNLRTLVMEEYPPDARKAGHMPQMHDRDGLPIAPFDNFYPYESQPRCFAVAVDLWKEGEFYQRRVKGRETTPAVPDEEGHGINFDEQPIKWQINLPRDCDNRKLSTPWKPGAIPKEHREMLDREFLTRLQARQQRFALSVAMLAVIVAVVGIVLSAWIGLIEVSSIGV